jgi:ABC-type transport system involved in cytochrome bd biosynthesis fused ATPase/permease subunit
MPINKALHIIMLMLFLAVVPPTAYAQRATAAASAKITTQQFSTKEYRTNANYQETKNSGTYVQQNYQSEEKERPCNTHDGRTKNKNESGISAKREEKKCLILMIELQ